MASSSPTSENQKRQWPLGLYGCFCYKSPITGKSRICPDFCLYSLLLSNSMTGKVWTQIHDEKIVCMNMGTVGILVCLMLIPVCVYSPMGGLICFGVIANYLRMKVVERYNVEDHNYFCCGSLDPCLNFFHNALSYPCSLFQMKVAMDEWDEENPKALASVVSPTAVVTAVPVEPVANVK